MKQIKKIVLKDATKLTNSEMKKIRGGYEPEYFKTCSAICYHSTGAIIGQIEQTCSDGMYCDIVSGTAEPTIACFDVTGSDNRAYNILPCSQKFSE